MPAPSRGRRCCRSACRPRFPPESNATSTSKEDLVMSRTRLKVSCAAFVAIASLVSLTGGAAAQDDCTGAVEKAKAEWRSLTHQTHLPAATRINTSDGRQLTGSQ